ncbi:peptidase [Shewanella electrodiphila]|uniref:Peptidase n=1 Tax=Shewanella electrodiphila TaxID=934143 RepID=A0ABT0KUM2_9GAMM|nr:peptidase [Shewanella electrodiphila]MCL1047545.1 peptidase [Shewanella electrodiphila]
MKTQKIKRWLRFCHYWLGTIVGIQLLIWLGTGIYFNITPSEDLKGTHYYRSIAPLDLTAFSSHDLEPLSSILERFKPMEQVSTIVLINQPVYLLDEQVQRYQHDCQQQVLVDAYSGKEVLIDADLAESIALQSYTGAGEIKSHRQLSTSFKEWPKECNPLWQVSISDDLNTRIYINGINGRLVGHKNDHTDLADLMFKLHFMDYLHQGSFNNPFSWVFGLMMLLLSLSGVYWVIENLVLKRYRFKFE